MSNTAQSDPLRLGVLLSGGGTTLVNLLREIQAGRLPAEIAVVVGSRPCPGLEKSRAASLPTHLVPYKETPSLQNYSGRIAEILDAARADLVVQAGFLSPWIIPDRYAGRVMNIHPALLPGFGGKGMYGRHVHEAVLRAGCKISGCTVHFVTNRYDDGPIILQRTVPVEEGDTPETLAARVFYQECIAYPEAIRLYAAGRIHIDGNVTHVSWHGPQAK